MIVNDDEFYSKIVELRLLGGERGRASAIVRALSISLSPLGRFGTRLRLREPLAWAHKDAWQLQ
eukprot:8258525-Prorocentrum_lima.AAC.1